MNTPPLQIAVAPMLDCTDRHDRYFLRLIAPRVKLYSEMITTQALIHGDYKKLLAFDLSEKYLALQLGGSDPEQLKFCARLGQEFGYDEINLNVGCPSDRVQAGQFGACLMLQPELVAECVAAMQSVVKIPVTVKCRIGVDDQEDYASLHYFVRTVANAGCKTFIVHARKAWLKGLSPKQNREIPPLQYDLVHQIKKDFPQLTIFINGGITSVSDVIYHENKVDGVMIGRAAYTNPYLLADIHRHYYRQQILLSRKEIVLHYLPYLSAQLREKTKLMSMTRHILGLYHCQRGANRWRRHLSENAHKDGAGIEVVREALALTNHEE